MAGLSLGSCGGDSNWLFFALLAILGSDHLSDSFLVAVAVALSLFVGFLLTWAFTPGGAAWRHGRTRLGRTAIPAPGQLMAFSIGSTPAVVSSDPAVAREILCHASFADRPLKRSARELMFARAMGFAPGGGAHWRLLRRAAASHLFCPRRVAAHEAARQADCAALLNAVAAEQEATGAVRLRRHLQAAALSNVMGTVFGKRQLAGEAAEIDCLVREGFELLGAFNWSDHLPWLALRRRRPRVRRLVRRLIAGHRAAAGREEGGSSDDFVDVLLSLQANQELDEDDMVGVLWEMVFRGTDTTVLLTEWAMAELVRHPGVQARLRTELEGAAGPGGAISDADAAALPYLQAVIKETLRAHPPGRCSPGPASPPPTSTSATGWWSQRGPLRWSICGPSPTTRASGLSHGSSARRGSCRRRAAPPWTSAAATSGWPLSAPAGGSAREGTGHGHGGALGRPPRPPVPVAPADGHPVSMAEVLKLSLEMETPLVTAAVPTSSAAAALSV
ncbi:unnamed protein product [Spirodela intermedia]|uniref:Uncharacterized protein n=1 Tax=Spirodela intermedia TaxID=51605 RepID=A0A7I8J2Z8_SPIIN|nr:unnamed protein product [Spirodela intermedia]CAA6664487.1 unnamed protein product [Spirodela intermedia]